MTPLINDMLDYSLSIRALWGLQASQPFRKRETSLSEWLPVNRGGRHLTRQGPIKLLAARSPSRKRPGPEGLRVNKEAALEIPSGYFM